MLDFVRRQRIKTRGEAVIDIKKEGASLVYDASSFFLVFVLFYDMQLVTPREAAIAVKIDSTI